MNALSQADATVVIRASRVNGWTEAADNAAQLQALVSIHDVMPSNLQQITELLEICARHNIRHPTLLVVPGLDWSDQQIEQLHGWQRAGCELAGHGWVHRCGRPTNLSHRVHSLVLSRDVAEHLSRSSAEVLELMSRCARWFEEHDFELPRLYVPPAWALGKVRADELLRQPFSMIETIRGVTFAHQQRHLRLPLLGFEADNQLRRVCLTSWNRLIRCSLRKTSCVRISIHPNDHRLLLADDLCRSLQLPMQPIRYDALLGFK